jgi:hypothetical protein
MASSFKHYPCNLQIKGGTLTKERGGSMRIVVNYAGKEYVSKSSSEGTAEQAKDMFYERLENLNKLELELENGWVLLPPDAMKACTIQFIKEEGE